MSAGPADEKGLYPSFGRMPTRRRKGIPLQSRSGRMNRIHPYPRVQDVLMKTKTKDGGTGRRCRGDGLGKHLRTLRLSFPET